MQPFPHRGRSAAALIVLLASIGGTEIGCSIGHRGNEGGEPAPSRHVVVVAPVLNLSGTTDLDPLKITDTIASEFLSFSTVSVVPVNLTLAALAPRDEQWVGTSEDAIELARELGADATVVTAITEYNPYDPPVVGLVMQWYSVPGRTCGTQLDPVAASRRATDPSDVELSGFAEAAPRFQLQRVFNAADNDVLEEVRDFARRRAGREGSYGWRAYIRSQELYVRYCSWSLIKSALRLAELEHVAATPSEAEP